MANGSSDLNSLTFVGAVTVAFALSAFVAYLLGRGWSRRPKGKVPVSVNYHFTRQCNKTCGFCFHT